MSKPTTPKTGREWEKAVEHIEAIWDSPDTVYEKKLSVTKHIIQSLLSQERQRIREGVERMKMSGDFAGAGTMKLLGMTSEDVTHDIKLQNEVLDDVLKLLGE